MHGYFHMLYENISIEKDDYFWEKILLKRYPISRSKYLGSYDYRLETESHWTGVYTVQVYIYICSITDIQHSLFK